MAAGGTWTMLKRTYCRICEAHCGLVVDVDEAAGCVRSVRPDREHPVSKGYSCVKGLGIGALHHDDDRLNFPMKRVNGKLVRISWTQAMSEIGAQIRALRQAHGPRVLGMYTGNPTYFSFQNILMSSGFLEALGSPNLFASHSVDNNNKLHVATEMFGRSMVHPVPDFERMQFFMCFGSNPMVSQMSMVHVPNSVERLKGIEARGGRVVIVDPRKTETAHRVGEHLAIQPGTDAYLLMAMLHVLVHEDRMDLGPAKAVARGVEAFVDAALPWGPDRVAPITGIAANTIRELAQAYRDADGAALYMSTGVNMGAFGSIAYWLLQGLNLITGNIDRRGGLLLPRGAFDTLKLAEWLGLGKFDDDRTLDGRWHKVAGCFPVSALAGEINNDHPERIRALIVSAGNPVHSVPNGQRLAKALEKLSLLVSIDIYPSETTEYADYVLPATDMLERSDYPASHALLQVVPHAQYTAAVVSPKFERREEWRIFSDMVVACGAKPLGGIGNVLPRINQVLKLLPGQLEATPDTVLGLLLRWGGQVTLDRLKKKPEGILLPETPAGVFLGKRVPTADGLVELYPPRVTRDLPRMEHEADRLSPAPGRWAIIGRRDRRTHNSWMHNNAHVKKPDGNRVLLHPKDAAQLGVDDGDAVILETPQGTLRLPAQLTEDVREGVVAVPHGWGHQTRTELSRASALAGANVNAVIPGGRENMEPVSGQAIMVGHAVEVRAAKPKQKGASAIKLPSGSGARV